MERIRKYFQTPHHGVVADPRYSKFALSLLERAHPSFIDVIASFNLEGEVTLRWPIGIVLNIVHHDENPNDFYILIFNHTGQSWDCPEILSSDERKVSELFAAFNKSTTFDDLMVGLGKLIDH